MPAGFQVFNSDGSLQFDTTNRLFRALTMVDTGGVAGNTSVSPTGSVLVAQQPADSNKRQPAVSVAGGTVSWTFPGSGAIDNTRLLIMEY